MRELIAILTEIEGKHGCPDCSACKQARLFLATERHKSEGEQLTYLKFAAVFGLPSDSNGKSFVSRGRTYTITGLNPSAPKFPVNATRDDGKKFRFPVSSVKLR